MTLAVWTTQIGTAGNVADDARLRGPNGALATRDNLWGQAGWHMGMRWRDLDDLVGQLRRGAPIPDYLEEEERSFAGCSLGTRIVHTFSRPAPYLQACAGDNRAVSSGEIRRLALNMHGYPGGLQVDGSRPDADGLPPIGLCVDTFTRYRDRVQTVLDYTTSDAVILFMGCLAGQGSPGTALLRRFSEAWPSRTFVAFTTIGVIAGGLMHQNRRGERAGGLPATEPGMRDSTHTSSPGENHDFTTTRARDGRSEWESYPWASETSPHAKVIQGGTMLRWGGETPPP